MEAYPGHFAPGTFVRTYFGPQEPLVGGFTHDVRVRERNEGGGSHIRVNLFQGALEYPIGGLHNLRHVWFIQEPIVTTKRYDYHEEAQFTPQGKQGWYTSDLVTHLVTVHGPGRSEGVFRPAKWAAIDWVT